VLATYPGVLFADTAVPAWHRAYRQLPVLFAGGALTAVGAAGLAAYAVSGDDSQAAPAQRLALLGAAAESLAGFGLETQLGEAGEPYRTGDGGALLRGARATTLAGVATALLARRSRVAAAAAAALLAGGGLCAKFAVLRAGVASASDPKYVVASQGGSGPAA
jgi:hypothetical protein